MILTLTMLRLIWLLYMTQSATLLQLHAVGETPGMLFIDLMMTGVPECDGPS